MAAESSTYRTALHSFLIRIFKTATCHNALFRNTVTHQRTISPFFPPSHVSSHVYVFPVLVFTLCLFVFPFFLRTCLSHQSAVAAIVRASLGGQEGPTQLRRQVACASLANQSWNVWCCIRATHMECDLLHPPGPDPPQRFADALLPFRDSKCRFGAQLSSGNELGRLE